MPIIYFSSTTDDLKEICPFTDPDGSISFKSVSTSGYTAGSGPIFFTGLRCTGQEENLVECPGSFGVHTCTHSQDVAVICPGEH